MYTYTIKFRLPKRLWWTRIREVRGDSIFFIKVEGKVQFLPVRVVQTRTEKRHEISHNHIFMFDTKERPRDYQGTYSLKYKAPGSMFWKRIRNVYKDSTLAHEGKALPVRIFWCTNGRRYEMPNSLVFKMSPGRHSLIHKSMEQQAGQSIAINTKI